MTWRALAAAIILAGSLFEVQAWAGPKHGTMSDAEATFNEVKTLIEENYVDPTQQDALWTGATEGMLQRLIQMEGHPTNHLLSPEEMAQLKVGLAGEITGIGVMIQDVAGGLVITKVLEGSGASQAGLQPDDRILAVDGERVKGKPLAEVTMSIRGAVGTTVTLLVQRDVEEWQAEVTRARVKVADVSAAMLSEDTGLLSIKNFTAQTPDDVKEALAALTAGGATRLVLDLRGCPGGLLDSAVSVSELFLAKGAPVVEVAWGGGDREVFSTKKRGAYADLPMVVLVDRGSASGAEILAAAISDNDRGLVLGETTFGKGTVEKIFDLQSGWAVKLSVAYFYSPKGTSWMGKGLTPDLPITGAPAGTVVSLNEDPVVRAAEAVLHMGR